MDLFKIEISTRAIKDFLRVPPYINVKLQSWVEGVGISGLSEMQKIKGYHDEPLHGKRKGQRSIRLSKAYRAIYRIDRVGTIHFIEIIEVNKHDY